MSDALNISRICLFTSQSVSQGIVIYLFIQFSKPVQLNRALDEDSDSDYEDEFDRMRDPNIDMLYYVKEMPKFQRVKDVDYNIDKGKGAIEYLNDEAESDGSFHVSERDYIDEDAKIDNFTDRL